MMNLKDNKIDIMCNKIGSMVTFIHGQENNTTDPVMHNMMKYLINALRTLQADLLILRKCSIDNPDFKWSEIKHDTRSGKGVTCFDEDGHEI